EDRVGEAFAGDLAVTAGTGFGGAASLSPKVADRLRALQQVQSATTLTSGRVRVDGESSEVTVGKPAHVADALSLQTTAGSLTGHGIAVSAPVAQANAWEVGSAVPVIFKDGARKQLPIDALYDESPVVGDYLLPSSTWSAHTTQDLDSVVYLSLVKGADIAEAETAVEDAVAPYGAPTVQDRDEYVDAQGQSVGMLLNLVYLMLALAIIIALMGIANTTALSVRERTRELGLLRAVGQTRRQMRAMVRGESMIVAVFGTVGGLALGTFLGVALAQAIDDVDVITVPLVTLLVILVVGAIAGVLAGRRPARRAARTDVLTAIAVE
ncbi:MAG: ABC transporter permease, partial [Nocardioidaceae bacterium]